MLIPVVNRLSKRIMRGCLLISQTPARACVCRCDVCRAGCGPIGVLIPALVATLIRESGTSTARLISYAIFTVLLHISAVNYFLTFYFCLICFSFNVPFTSPFSQLSSLKSPVQNTKPNCAIKQYQESF